MGNLFCCATSSQQPEEGEDDLGISLDNDEDNERRETNTRRFSLINPPSTTTERRSSNRVDLTAAKGGKKELKLLLLGTGESGKSTIVKQMKILHEQHGFTPTELALYRSAIYRNVHEAALQVLEACGRLGVKEIAQAEAAGNPHLRYLREVKLDYDQLTVLPPELVRAVQWLWLESGVRNGFAMIVHASYILDSAQ